MYCHHSIIPTNPHFLHVTTPETISFGRGHPEDGGEQLIRIREARDHDHVDHLPCYSLYTM